MSQSRSLVAHIDAVYPSLTGWAGLQGDTTGPVAPIALSLLLGQHRLGAIRPTMPRPDVDQALGYGGTPKGFEAPVAAIAAFADLTASADLKLVAETPDAQTPLALPVPSTRAPALRWLEPAQGWVLRDVWFSTSRRLALRFEADTTAPTVRLLAFQVPARPDGARVRLPVSGSLTQGVGQVSIELLNPYLPLLLIMVDGEDVIVGCDWLPFPSLARGALHHPEVQCQAAGGNLLSAMAALSDRLVEGLHARRTTDEARNLCCDRMVFDTRSSTGSEPMFDPDLTDMITAHLGVSIKVLPAPDAASTSDIADRLRAQIRNAPVKPSPDSVALHIGGDASPTLGGLILPYLFELGAAQPDAAHIVVREDQDAAWLVTPSTDGTGSYPGIPRAKASPSMVGSVHTAAPVAIRSVQRPTRMVASSAFPTASDDDMGLSASEPVTVLVLATPGSQTSPSALLQSLAEQIHCPIGQLLLVIQPGEDAGSILPLLQALFPDRHALLTIDGRRGRMDMLRQAAGHAQHDRIAVVADDVILHDRRTLAVLSGELDDPALGTAACMLIRQDMARSYFAAAGYLLKTIDFQARPSLVFDAPDARGILPDRYCVVAAPLSVTLTRKGVLQSLPASLTRSDRIATEDVRFGLEVLRLGYRNLVTTRISATTSRTDLTTPALFATLPFDFGMAFLQRIADATTGLTRL